MTESFDGSKGPEINNEPYFVDYWLIEGMVTDEDRVLTPDDRIRMRTIQAGDPVGDYYFADNKSAKDAQESIIAHEKAAQRLRGEVNDELEQMAQQPQHAEPDPTDKMT